MNSTQNSLLTPIHVKTHANGDWPDDPVFYLMTADGLFLCRNHPFFRSSVRAPRWPSELAWHEPFLRSRYPRIAQRTLEEIVGFFDRVADLHGSEAVVLVVWNRQTRAVEIVVPPQVATVSRNRWGGVFPIGVEYDAPVLGSHQSLLGDIHSHVDMAAYASGVDRQDEEHRAGLHVVVGRLYLEPPDFHIEAVVDGTRFLLEPAAIFADYHRRRSTFPRQWLDRVRIKMYGSSTSRTASYSYSPKGAAVDSANDAAAAVSITGGGDNRLPVPSGNDQEQKGREGFADPPEGSRDDSHKPK